MRILIFDRIHNTKTLPIVSRKNYRQAGASGRSVEQQAVETVAKMGIPSVKRLGQYSAGAVLRDSRNPTFGDNWGNVGYQIKPICWNVDRNMSRDPLVLIKCR